MDRERFRIGEVAKQAGVNLQTIHYYERRGLLPEPPRTDSNYRAYPPDAILRVRFINARRSWGSRSARSRSCSRYGQLTARSVARSGAAPRPRYGRSTRS